MFSSIKYVSVCLRVILPFLNSEQRTTVVESINFSSVKTCVLVSGSEPSKVQRTVSCVCGGRKANFFVKTAFGMSLFCSTCKYRPFLFVASFLTLAESLTMAEESFSTFAKSLSMAAMFKATGSLLVGSSLIRVLSKGSLLLQAISRKNGKNKKK